MKIVKLGIIGVGGIAMGRHIKEILECSDAKLVALCDTTERAMDKAIQNFGLCDVRKYTDYRELIADSEVEAIEICTPNDLHAQMAIDVLKAGKPVNLEKPVALDYSEALTITEAEKTSDSFGMTCFTYRFMPAVRYAKALVDSGAIGDVIGLNVAYLKNSALWEGRRLEWRFQKKRAGSGVIGDLGVHLIDLAQLLAGKLTDVCAIKKTVVTERKCIDSEEIAPVETDDLCSFLGKFENGASATFHITRCAIGHINTIRYDVYGSKGSISFDLNNPDILTICTGEGDPKNYKNTLHNVPEEYKLSQEQAFVNAVKGKRDALYPTLEDGVKGQKIIDSIIESSIQNKWIQI